MDALLDVLTNELTSELVPRHVEEIERFSKDRRETGIALSELPLLIAVLDVLARKEGDEGNPHSATYSDALYKLLQVCERPFVQETANAKYHSADTICTWLCTTSVLLLSQSSAVKIGAANVLFEFCKQSEKRAAKANPLDQRPNEWTYNQQLFQRSGAMELVAEAIKMEVKHLFRNDVDGDGRISQAEYERAYGILANDENPQPQVSTVSLMKLVRELAAYRDNALSLNRENVPNQLVKVVSQLVDFRKEEIKLMIQILWSVLEHSVERISASQVASTRMQLIDKFRHANALFCLGNAETIGMLRSLLERMLLEGYKASDKELRNEVLIISSLLARRQRNLAHFRETGFLSLLILYATAAENELPTGCEERHYATSDPLDLEMKYLLWYLIKALCQDSTNLIVVQESLFVSSLLFYMHPGRKLRHWSEQQLRGLQKEAMLILGSMVPIMPKGQLGQEEVARVTTFLRYCHEVGDEELLVDVLELALVLVRQLPQELLGALPLKLIVQHMDTAESAALIVASLDNAALKPVRKSDQALELLLGMAADPTCGSNRQIAALACLHRVARNQSSLLELAARGGVERLLDSLEQTAAIELKGVFLAVLADAISEGGKHVDALVREWRSPHTGRSAAALALDTWLEACGPPESARLDRGQALSVVSSRVGSTNRASAALRQALLAAQSFMTPDLERRVLQSAVDVRDRVVAFVGAMGFSTIERADLTRDQRALLALAENYAIIAQDEAWEEVELPVRPIFADRAFLQSQRDRARKAVEQSERAMRDEEDAKDRDGSLEDEALWSAIRDKRDQAIQARKVKNQVSLMKRRLELKQRQKAREQMPPPPQESAMTASVDAVVVETDPHQQNA